MDSATLAIAIIGAATGIAGLAWQVYIWSQARKSRVTVQLGNTDLPVGISDCPGLLVRVANDNSYAIHVEAVGLKLQNGSGGDYEIENDESYRFVNLPGTVAGHGLGHAALRHDESSDAGFDLYEPIIAWVKLASGEWIHSEPFTALGRD